MESRPYRRERLDPEVAAAVAVHGAHPGALLPVLQALQARRGGLTAEALGAVADALRVPDERVFGVATFYALFSTGPCVERVIRVCDSPVCEALGARDTHAALEAAARGEGWSVERASCLGLCDRAPAALRNDVSCGPVTPASAGAVVREAACPPCAPQAPAAGEERIVLARVGRIDPESLESAAAAGAYEGLRRGLAAGPASVLRAVDDANLRGRGGAGFPVGRKWRMVAEAAGRPKVVVCNADESEPGTFKDRVIMEGDPHRLLEGMALAGLAVGAAEGIVYIRGEYEAVARRLERAVEAAGAGGWLGDRIRGTAFSFPIHVHRGSGAYICGEETALLESLEGKRGEPRARPPYPATHGYLGRPTLVNNVETLAAVPDIVARGAAWWRSLGAAHSPGTKLFCLSGQVCRPGVYEAPLGVTLRQLLEGCAGGMRDGMPFHVALTGGAAGRFVGERALDLPLDFAWSPSGPLLGSGAMMFFGPSVSVPRLLRSVLHFFEVESCGKCTPCRVGTRELRMVAERLEGGRGRPEDVEALKRMAELVGSGSFCGLGQSVAWPVKSALEHFEAEFREGVARG